MTLSLLSMKIIVNYYFKYIIKRKKLTKLNLITDEYDDWRSEITKWYNNWVTDDYSIISKQLFCTENYFVKSEKVYKLIIV